MILGLLPEIRGGLGELARAGQHSRFIDGYLKPYARAFDEIRYFSYRVESLEDYTDDAQVRASVRLLAATRWHPWAYAFVMPLRYWRELRGCSVLRVFQVTGVIPALAAKWRFGVPFVTTYGFPSRRPRRPRLRGGLRGRVESVRLDLVPSVDHRELPRLYGAADVFVLPSFTEGHSKVLLEAMSCGLPCVASDIGANRSVLADGDAGLLFDPHDAGALAARLEQVLGH